MPELIDIIDKHGKPLNVAKARDAVHRDGDWHRTVHVWVINSKKEILLQKRAFEKETFPNLWDISCAGHIQAGKTSIDGAIQEVREELGINVTSKDLNYLFTIIGHYIARNGTFIDNELSDVYLVKKDFALSDFKIQVEELCEVRWLLIDDFKNELETNPQNFVPHKEAYKKLFDFLDVDIR